MNLYLIIICQLFDLLILLCRTKTLLGGGRTGLEYRLKINNSETFRVWILFDRETENVSYTLWRLIRCDKLDVDFLSTSEMLYPFTKIGKTNQTQAFSHMICINPNVSLARVHCSLHVIVSGTIITRIAKNACINPCGVHETLDLHHSRKTKPIHPSKHFY